MATFKFIEPTADNVREMQLSMHDVDCSLQEVQEHIEAAVEGIKALLAQPDSDRSRASIVTLCKHINDQALSAMNEANSHAEQWGANHIDEAEAAHG